MPPIAAQLTADFHTLTHTLVAILNGDHGRAREPGLRDHLHHMLMATENGYRDVMDRIGYTLAQEPLSGEENAPQNLLWRRDVRQGTFASALDSCDHLLGENEMPTAPVFRQAMPTEQHQAVIADLRPLLVRSHEASDHLRDYRRAYFQHHPHTTPWQQWYLAVGHTLKDVILWSPLLNDLTLAVENWHFDLLMHSLAELDAGIPFVSLAGSATDTLQIDITHWQEGVNASRISPLTASDGTANPLEHALWELTLLTAVKAAHMGNAQLTYTGERTFTLQLPEA